MNFLTGTCKSEAQLPRAKDKTRQDAALCSWLAMDHEPRNWAIVSRSMTMQMQMQMQMQRKRKRKCEVTPKCEREIHIFS